MSQDAAVHSDGQTMTPAAPAADPAAPERDGADDWKAKARLWESRTQANGALQMPLVLAKKLIADVKTKSTVAALAAKEPKLYNREVETSDM